MPPTAHVIDADIEIGGCRLGALAEEFGTPLYVVDSDGLRQRARAYRAAFMGRHRATRLLFATKAFPSASVLRVLAEEGFGADVVGAGELAIARAAGVDPATIVMHGNAKTDADIAAALLAGIGSIVVDGFDDIDRISRLANRRTPVLLRINPGVESATHAAWATGGAGAKFGVPLSQVDDAIRRMRAEPVIDLRGLHVHIGSQLVDLEQVVAAIAALASVQRFGVYDVGGGLAVRYLPEEPALSIDEYAQRLVDAVHQNLGSDVEILIEPGRSVVAPVMVTVYRVVTVKRGTRVHVAVDGGMGDNLEPALYGQRFAPLVLGHWDGAAEVTDLVGRHCESGDVIVADTPLVDPRVGDLIVVPVTGAYCFTMANNYNGALRPPVVFCAEGRADLRVRRETIADLLDREVGIDRP
jgi:diaminopimelate decarboxylase